jgi:plastocyanin
MTSTIRRGAGLVGLALALLMAAPGCGEDTDDTGGGDDGVSGDSAQSAEPCRPVGEAIASAATRTVPVELREFSFTPATVDVSAGVVTFAARNAGTENHEVAFLPGGGEVPLNSQGEPDEDALEAAGAFELEAFGAGQSCNATYDLRPGAYTLFCIVTSTDGQTHYQKGMRGRLTVA